eukprot:2920094-Rhodomonas_salina.8
MIICPSEKRGRVCGVIRMEEVATRHGHIVGESKGVPTLYLKCERCGDRDSAAARWSAHTALDFPKNAVAPAHRALSLSLSAQANRTETNVYLCAPTGSLRIR